MDARGRDRPLAVVCGRASPLAAAFVSQLLSLGYDVHVPATMTNLGYLVVRWPEQFHLAAGSPENEAAWQEMLNNVAVTRQPMALAVVCRDGSADAPWETNPKDMYARPAPSPVLALATTMQTWREGRLLLVSDHADSRRSTIAAGQQAVDILMQTARPRATVTVLVPRRRWLPSLSSLCRVLGFTAITSVDDPTDVARRGLDGAFAGRWSVTHSGRSCLPPQ